MNLTWNTKIKVLQGVCFFGGPLILVFNFNAAYLFFAWFFSWIAVHIGISIGMHRCFSHRSWEPKNKIILVIIHFLSVINTVGSTITWTGTHRKHHRHADTSEDPHSIVDKTIWTRIKYWFNYWPAHVVETKYVRDLIRDPYHKFFHKHYFKILLSYVLILLLIDIDLFLYGYVVATMFSLHTISWITVGAHIFGTKDNNVQDSSKNTFLMGLYSWGEGWHNNHHAKPWSYEFGWGKQPDLGKYLIRLIGNPQSLRSADSPRPY
jgi:fatty-acid desaturase